MRRAALIAAWLVIGCADAGPTPPDPDAPDTTTDVGPDTDDGDAPDTTETDAPPPAAWPVHEIDIEIAPADWEILHFDPQQHIEVPCAMTLDGVKYTDSELEIHGGYARKLPKKSYRLTVPDDAESDWDLFGEGPERHRRFVLQAAWVDPTFLRNKLTMDLMLALGGLAPRIAFARVLVNGQFHGFYTLIERIDRPYLTRHGLETAALMYKAENHSANWAAKEDPLKGYAVKLGEDVPPDDLAGLLEAASYTEKTFAAFEAALAPLLHMDDLHAFQIVHTFAMNRDTFTKNYYLHRPLGASGVFRLISWDADATWAGDWDGTDLEPTQDKWHGTDTLSPRLYAVNEYKAEYLSRYQTALEMVFEPDDLVAIVEGWGEIIAPYVAEDFAKWERKKVFSDEIDRLVDAVQARHAVMTDVIAKEQEAL